MKKIIFLFILLQTFSQRIFSQCAETDQPKVLLAGDSWAFFMNADQTFNNVFRKWGFSNFKFVSNSTISENGAQTDDFLTATKLNEIKSQLNQNPSIEVVHLSIGGNDVLGEWKVSWSPSKTDSLKTAVEQRLHAIIDSIKSFKQGIRIVWSGYTYPNFEEVIKDFFIPAQHPFYGTWQGMEFPTFLQLNTILNDFSAEVEAFAATDPQVDFVNATGILQYTFGQSTPLGVAPGGTYAPFSVPLPAGKPDYPSPKSSMRDYFGIAKDCFHLSAQGYEDMIDYQFQKFYHKFFMDNFYATSESGNKTGSVSSQGAVSQLLNMGESGGAGFSTVLSFNTAAMFDTTVSKASIFLRRENLNGANPVGSMLQVSIKNGNLGASADVDASDYGDNGDASGTACVFGSNAANGNWIRIELPDQLLPHIRNNSTVQFIIAAPSGSGGLISFYGSSVTDFAPVLNVTYGESPFSSVQERSRKNFTVYPNPSGNVLNIDAQGEKIMQLEITDLMGRAILKNEKFENPVDISVLATGTYLLNITTGSGRISKRILKM
jgi:lysophospholipase L1-like esterase